MSGDGEPALAAASAAAEPTSRHGGPGGPARRRESSQEAEALHEEAAVVLEKLQSEMSAATQSSSLIEVQRGRNALMESESRSLLRDAQLAEKHLAQGRQDTQREV